jgi:PKD repeat protein
MRKLIMGLAVSSMILTACNKAPELGMTVPTTGVAGENVAMTSGGDIKKAYNVNWSFGDGGSAATFDANHTYSEAGTYTVTLTATNRKGSNATTATSIITISDNGIDAVETKMEEEAVAMDAWWTKAAGTWSFGTGSINYLACGDNEAASNNIKSRTTAVKITIGQEYNESYIVNENNEMNIFSFEVIDADHVYVGNLRFLAVNSAGTFVNDHATMEEGIYSYVNDGSKITLTRIVEQIEQNFTSGDPACIETRTFTYTLTK